ncbi:hypothetical protein LCGC14_0730340 [marine sediment metagenome]|uniref:Uncharacterized protein n=1 Tax=marine sediment metagenome TaxID=412755 RepID=A0A0F9SUX3_9ZZZZ
MREVRVFVNTRPYKILSVKYDRKYVEIFAAEDLAVCCPKSLNKPIRMKKFTAGIDHNKDGYYADIFSDELKYDEEGILRYIPEETQ